MGQAKRNRENASPNGSSGLEDIAENAQEVVEEAVDGATGGMFGKIGKAFRKAFGPDGDEKNPKTADVPDMAENMEHFEDSSVRFGENGSVTEEIEKRRADMERFRKDQSGDRKIP